MLFGGTEGYFFFTFYTTTFFLVWSEREEEEMETRERERKHIGCITGLGDHRWRRSHRDDHQDPLVPLGSGYWSRESNEGRGILKKLDTAAALACWKDGGRGWGGPEELYYYHYLESQRRLGGYAPLTQLWRMDGMGWDDWGEREGWGPADRLVKGKETRLGYLRRYPPWARGIKTTKTSTASQPANTPFIMIMRVLYKGQRDHIKSPSRLGMEPVCLSVCLPPSATHRHLFPSLSLSKWHKKALSCVLLGGT